VGPSTSHLSLRGVSCNDGRIFRGESLNLNSKTEEVGLEEPLGLAKQVKHWNTLIACHFSCCLILSSFEIVY